EQPDTTHREQSLVREKPACHLALTEAQSKTIDEVQRDLELDVALDRLCAYDEPPVAETERLAFRLVLDLVVGHETSMRRRPADAGTRTEDRVRHRDSRAPERHGE